MKETALTALANIDIQDFLSLEFRGVPALTKAEYEDVEKKNSQPLSQLLCQGKYHDIIESSSVSNFIALLKKNLDSCSSCCEIDDVFAAACSVEVLDLISNFFGSFAEYLCVPIAYLKLFIQENWTGPPLNPELTRNVSSWVDVLFSKWNHDSKDKLRTFLIADGESVCQNAKHLELLVAAQFLFKLNKFYNPFQEWWFFRSIMLQQRIIEERSKKLHDILIRVSESILPHMKTLSPDIHKAFLLEVCQYHLNLYAEVGKAKMYLQNVENEFNMDVKLRGALGKRTKFQDHEVAQLFLQVNTKDPEPDENRPEINNPVSSHLPKDISLHDEVRLNEINFSDDSVKTFPNLSPLQQAIILCHFRFWPLPNGKVNFNRHLNNIIKRLSKFNLNSGKFSLTSDRPYLVVGAKTQPRVSVYTRKSQPKDDLENEELCPYLFCVLRQPQCWGLQTLALIYRSQLEHAQPKALERSLAQLECLVNNFSSNEPAPAERQQLFFYIHLPPIWEVEADLAEIFVTIGLIQSALDVYLRIEFWEQIVACYNHLNLRHKAAEVLQNELEKKETPKLYCLLGDATDNTEYYLKAWELSGQRSARAQRHWGMYYYNRKQYGECIPFFEKSLSLNSLQPEILYRLGFASLEQSQWEKCASAYRNYCILQPDCFEAWNNLAKAYVKRGEKHRALTALREAVKCNFENWRVWDNLLVVSTDCADFETLILSYHRLLDLRGKHVDVEVLQCLVKAISQNLTDIEGKSSSTHLKAALKLFGRITSLTQNNARIWQLYAELTSCVEESSQESFDKVSQYFQRAHKAAVQDFNWFKNVSNCKDVLLVCLSLAKSYRVCREKCSDPRQLRNMLSSAKLSINSVLSKIRQEHTDLITGNVVVDLQETYSELLKEFEFFEKELSNVKNVDSS